MQPEADESKELTQEEKEFAEQLKAIQESEQAYLTQAFKWLIEFVASYFPEDQLALEDAGSDVHFIHMVRENGKLAGVLVYRFRKIPDKKAYFSEIEEEYRTELEAPEVLFVDSETSQFSPPETLESQENFTEIPPEKLTGKIRELREELKRRSRIRQLRESL
jgi:Fic family protein